MLYRKLRNWISVTMNAVKSLILIKLTQDGLGAVQYLHSKGLDIDYYVNDLLTEEVEKIKYYDELDKGELNVK